MKRGQTARQAQARAEEKAKAAEAAAEELARALLRERRTRIATGFLAILVIAAVFGGLVATGSIHGTLGWGLSVTILVLACAGAACWGLRGWNKFLAILIGVSALITPGAIAVSVANSKTAPATISASCTRTQTTGKATPPSQKHSPGYR
jgi:F0F1-type ATP synthase assembly protein I